MFVEQNGAVLVSGCGLGVNRNKIRDPSAAKERPRKVPLRRFAGISEQPAMGGRLT